jgi:hypothetical protein
VKACWIALSLGLAACNGRTPLPAGPPPEYQEPRSYEPKRNIDEPGTEPDPIDQLLNEEPQPSSPAGDAAGHTAGDAGGDADAGAAPMSDAAADAGAAPDATAP